MDTSEEKPEGGSNSQLNTTDFDVVIIGAGISGINSAYRVQTQAPPGTSYTILEARDNIGGTWDLFKYPGIRSDSDLYTFGFAWQPWTDGAAVAEAPLILDYVKESAAKYGIDKKMRFRHKVIGADWRAEEQVWKLDVDVKGGQRKVFTAGFLIFGTGYYDYDTPLETVIPGIENFKGKVVHPQFWPEHLDYADKEIVVIGSGATAITILPNIAKAAKHVTMVQRSPSYVLSLPNSGDPITAFLQKWFSIKTAFVLNRARFLIMTYALFYLSRTFPHAARKVIRFVTTKELPPNVPHDPHFSPSYNPWEQRMCLDPDGVFYRAMRKGKAHVVTGVISTVTPTGLQMVSGETIKTDIIVTATGLKLLLAGGVNLSLDGHPFTIANAFMWKGMMLQNLPNAVFVVGYTNASWTLGADATAQLTTRLLRTMAAKGVRAVVPRLDDSQNMKPAPMLNLSSTYIQRAVDIMPRTGTVGPWRPRKHYFGDISEAKWGNMEVGLEYLKEPKKEANGSLH
jgi:cation diffusion facilitator CzcD-associated flavoprotein CzcO